MDVAPLRTLLVRSLLVCLPLSACAPDRAQDQAAAPSPAAADADPGAGARGGAGTTDVPAAALVVEEAWIRSAPPGASALAGYAVLRNRSDSPIAVHPCATSGFAAVEVHRTTHEDGVARMRRVREVEIAANGEAVLAPGGMHLMLMEPAVVPAAGQGVEVCLAHGSVQARHRFEVRALPAG